MSRLRAISDLGIAVTWDTLLVGLMGPGGRGEMIQAREVLEYAADVASRSLEVSPELAELLTEPSIIEAILDPLEALARRDSEGADREMRKWRLILLQETLDTLPTDPVYALTLLTDFWLSFGFPSDSPHVVQGRGNTISPNEYYTAAFRDRIIAAHHAWIEKERAELKRGPKVGGSFATS